MCKHIKTMLLLPSESFLQQFFVLFAETSQNVSFDKRALKLDIAALGRDIFATGSEIPPFSRINRILSRQKQAFARQPIRFHCFPIVANRLGLNKVISCNCPFAP